MSDDWDTVNSKVKESKIFRFPYKKLLGESLTSYVTRHPQLSYEDIRENLLKEPTIDTYLRNKPHLYPKFFENLKTSVSSRKAEQKTYEGRK